MNNRVLATKIIDRLIQILRANDLFVQGLLRNLCIDIVEEMLNGEKR